MTPSRLRLVLLGASNLTRGLPWLLAAVRERFGGPFDAWVAAGNGRGYGCPGRYAARTLPPVVDCGLWNALGDRPAPTLGLLSDVGNDLMFGLSPEQVAARVEECAERLAALGAPTVLTRLPLGSLRRLRPLPFLLLRNLLFPGRRYGLPQVLDWTDDLDRRLTEIAARRGLATVRPSTDWYGFDPIHVRRGARTRAWGEVAAAWPEVQAEGEAGLSEPADQSPAENPGESKKQEKGAAWAVVRAARMPYRALESAVFGIGIHREQPAARLPDGSRLFLY